LIVTVLARFANTLNMNSQIPTMKFLQLQHSGV